MTRFGSADFAAHLDSLAKRQPEASAWLAPGRDAMNYAELGSRIASVRRQFGEWGIGPGDVVAWPVVDRVASAAALAIVPASATLLPMASTLTVDAYERVFARIQPKAVVVPARHSHAAADAATHAGVATIAIDAAPAGVAGAFGLELLRDDASLRQPPRVARDVLFVSLTSGTTGRPKLVPHAWPAVSATAHALGARLAFSRHDVSAHITTLHLANGLRTSTLLSLLHGGAVDVLPEGDLDAFLRAIAAGEVTYTSATFAMHRELLRRLDDGQRIDRGRLRFVRVASGRLEPDEMDRLEAHLGVPVVTGLSTTETGTIAQQPLPPSPRRRGSVGLPVAVDIRIADDAGVDLPRGATGEVQVRGAQVFDGYLDDPDLNAAAFIDGWFRLGDLGRIDVDGELHVVGRLKDIINRGGEKIAPHEIDAVLLEIPGVADAAAFGVPHPALGEEVVAAVVRDPGATIDAETLIARVRSALGDRRSPRRVWFVGALPRTEAGKLRRAALPGWVGFRDSAPADADTASASWPSSPLEIALAALWTAALRRSRVGLDENFFMLGGDSLRGVNLLAQVHAVFSVDIPVQALFDDANTVSGMARRIARERAAR